MSGVAGRSRYRVGACHRRGRPAEAVGSVASLALCVAFHLVLVAFLRPRLRPFGPRWCGWPLGFGGVGQQSN